MSRPAGHRDDTDRGAWARWGLVLVVVLVLVATPASYARWTAQASVPVPAATSGALDLRVAGSLAGAGGTVTPSGGALSPAAIPGESVAVTLTVANGGDAPFEWTATGTANGALAPSLLVSLHPGGTASSTGTAAAGTRRGSCSTAAVFGPAALTTSPTSLVGTGRRIEPGATEQLCVVVALSSSAPSSAQGSSGAPTLLLSARQVAR